MKDFNFYIDEAWKSFIEGLSQYSKGYGADRFIDLHQTRIFVKAAEQVEQCETNPRNDKRFAYGLAAIASSLTNLTDDAKKYIDLLERDYPDELWAKIANAFLAIKATKVTSKKSVDKTIFVCYETAISFIDLYNQQKTFDINSLVLDASLISMIASEMNEKRISNQSVMTILLQIPWDSPSVKHSLPEDIINQIVARFNDMLKRNTNQAYSFLN